MVGRRNRIAGPPRPDTTPGPHLTTQCLGFEVWFTRKALDDLRRLEKQGLNVAIEEEEDGAAGSDILPVLRAALTRGSRDFSPEAIRVYDDRRRRRKDEARRREGWGGLVSRHITNLHRLFSRIHHANRVIEVESCWKHDGSGGTGER